MSYVPISALTLSSDEESVFWQCQLQLAKARDYGRFPRDTAFTLELFGIEYQLVVDSRELSRSMDEAGNQIETAMITGLSPACRHTSPRATPFSRTWTEPVTARAAVETILGEAVSWEILDWIIPAYRLAAVNAIPLDLAKQIVGAAGGLLECLPDGHLRARYRFPVSIPDQASVSPDLQLTEHDIYSVSETPLNDDLRNRFQLVDVETSYADRLEWIAEEGNPLRGNLAAYLSPWRDDLRITTSRGTPPIVYWPIGVSTHLEMETVEFTAGHATTKYPIMSLQNLTWLSTDLGGIVFEPYTSDLTCTAPDDYGGYSLALLSYLTKRLDYGVECLNSPIDAQFLLIEGDNNG